MLRALGCVVLLACGSSTPAPPPRVAPTSTPDDAARAEQARRAELAAAHRVLEDEQQTALALTCEPGTPPGTHERCEPSCYRGEPPDPRAGAKLGRAPVAHLVCRSAGSDEPGPLVFADELAGAALAVRPARGRMPKPHRKGTWQADLARDVAVALAPELRDGDVIQVTGAWRAKVHPVTQEALRCVTVAHHARSTRRPLDACGAHGTIACEAMGNAAVHGLNVVHYRLAEARRLHAAGKDAECRRASLEAIAVAHGMPRWLQYVSLNTNAWKSYPRYRTRFTGLLDETALFATAATLGADAQVVHVECGGAASPTTTAAQQQSFHACW